MRNTSDKTVLIRMKTNAKNKHGVSVPPGQTIDVPDEIALPRRADNGDRRPSVIEEIAPQMQPANEADMAQWSQTPEHEHKVVENHIPSVQELVRLGTAPSVAVLMVKQALAAESEKLKLWEESQLMKVKDIVKEPKNKKVE